MWVMIGILLFACLTPILIFVRFGRLPEDPHAGLPPLATRAQVVVAVLWPAAYAATGVMIGVRHRWTDSTAFVWLALALVLAVGLAVRFNRGRRRPGQ